MNRQAVAKELLAIASELIEADSDLPRLELKQLDREAGVFPSQKSLQDYMREHPDAKRGQHKVNYREWKRKYRKTAANRFYVVMPKGMSWHGDSPIDRAIWKSPSGGAMVLEEEPSNVERIKWDVQEFSTLQQARDEVQRDWEAGI